MTSLSLLLKDVGLEHCLSTLVEDDIDLDCLLLFTAEDVHDLEISDVDKKTLINTIQSICIDRDKHTSQQQTSNQEVSDFLFEDDNDSNMYIRKELSIDSMNDINNMEYESKDNKSSSVQETSRLEADTQRFEEANQHVHQAFEKVFSDPSLVMSPSSTTASSFPKPTFDVSISRRRSSGTIGSGIAQSGDVLTHNIAVGKELVPRDSLESHQRKVMNMNDLSLNVQIQQESSSGGGISSIGAIHRLSPPPPPVASPAAILEVTSSLSKDATFESWLASQETKYSVPKTRLPRTQFRSYVEQRRTVRGNGGNISLPSLKSLNNITTTLKASYSEPRITAVTSGFKESRSFTGNSAPRVGKMVPMTSHGSMSNISRNNSAMYVNQRGRLATPPLSRAPHRTQPRGGLPTRALNGNWASRQGSVRGSRRLPPPSQFPKLTLSNSAPRHY